MLFKMETCKDLIDFFPLLSCLDVCRNILIYTNCHVVELCSVVNLAILKKYMYWFDAYTGRQRNY